MTNVANETQFDEVELQNLKYKPLIDPDSILSYTLFGRSVTQLIGVLTPSFFLVACGGGGGNGEGGSVDDESNKPTPKPKPIPISKEDAARFLLQAQFSSTLEEIVKVQKMGYEAWIDEQLSMPESQTTTDWVINNIDDYTIKTKNNTEIIERMFWKQLFTCPDTLRKRMALALSEIYVVSIYHINFPYKTLCIADYWDMLNRHAFGNFRNLIQDVSRHLAMGQFLDILRSRKASKNGNRQPDENYARELMQLMTIGLVQLNLDGSEKKQNGNSIETYDLNTVREIARVFTGYEKPEALKKFPTRDVFKEPMSMNLKMHDFDEKNIMGYMFPATPVALQTEEVAIAELTQVLDILFNHDNVAPFISKQLIQRFVTSNPSANYIKRVATVFNNSKGVKGDFKAVLKAILLDPEARETIKPTDPRYKTYGKAREPMIMFCQWGRTFTNGTSVSGKWETRRADNAGIGQVPMGSGSVFNFFRPGDAPSDAEFKNSKTLAPELYLVDTVSVQDFSNFIYKHVNVGMRHMTVWSQTEVALQVGDLEAMAMTPQTAVDHLNLIMCAGSMRASTKQHIIDAMNSIALTDRDDTEKRIRHDRARLALWMTMISPEFRVQK